MVVPEELGNGGTGGRFRTGVEGAWEIGFESRGRVGCVWEGEFGAGRLTLG